MANKPSSDKQPSSLSQSLSHASQSVSHAVQSVWHLAQSGVYMVAAGVSFVAHAAWAVVTYPFKAAWRALHAPAKPTAPEHAAGSEVPNPESVKKSPGKGKDPLTGVAHEESAARQPESSKVHTDAKKEAERQPTGHSK